MNNNNNIVVQENPTLDSSNLLDDTSTYNITLNYNDTSCININQKEPTSQQNTNQNNTQSTQGNQIILLERGRTPTCFSASSQRKRNHLDDSGISNRSDSRIREQMEQFTKDLMNSSHRKQSRGQSKESTPILLNTNKIDMKINEKQSNSNKVQREEERKQDELKNHQEQSQSINIQKSLIPQVALQTGESKENTLQSKHSSTFEQTCGNHNRLTEQILQMTQETGPSNLIIVDTMESQRSQGQFNEQTLPNEESSMYAQQGFCNLLRRGIELYTPWQISEGGAANKSDGSVSSEVSNLSLSPGLSEINRGQTPFNRDSKIPFYQQPSSSNHASHQKLRSNSSNKNCKQNLNERSYEEFRNENVNQFGETKNQIKGNTSKYYQLKAAIENSYHSKQISFGNTMIGEQKIDKENQQNILNVVNNENRQQQQFDYNLNSIEQKKQLTSITLPLENTSEFNKTQLVLVKENESLKQKLNVLLQNEIIMAKQKQQLCREKQLEKERYEEQLQTMQSEIGKMCQILEDKMQNKRKKRESKKVKITYFEKKVRELEAQLQSFKSQQSHSSLIGAFTSLNSQKGQIVQEIEVEKRENPVEKPRDDEMIMRKIEEFKNEIYVSQMQQEKENRKQIENLQKTFKQEMDEKGELIERLELENMDLKIKVLQFEEKEKKENKSNNKQQKSVERKKKNTSMMISDKQKKIKQDNIAIGTKLIHKKSSQRSSVNLR